MTEALMGISPQRTELPVPTPPQPAGRASPEAVQRKPVAQLEGAAADAGATATEPVKNLFSQEEIADTLHQMNLIFDMFEIQAQFSVSKENHEIQVVLRNTRTGEVIRRIPPGEFAQNFTSFKDGIGLLFNRIF